MNAAKLTKTRESQLLLAATVGAARELFEETGIDLRRNLHRIQPVPLHNGDEKRPELMENEYKHRLFFTVTVKDGDFPRVGVPPMDDVGKHLKVCAVSLAFVTSLASILSFHMSSFLTAETIS
jgi:8-oxo-dGTP pyrophosphatase MutT (NUDIX family)